MRKKFLSASPADTTALGRFLGMRLERGDCLALFGELGSGKTTLIKGVVDSALSGAPVEVTSPTFCLVNVYTATARPAVYHIDLYRIKGVSELSGIGWDEYVTSREGASIIEWADKAVDFLPEDYLKIELEHLEKDFRLITISALTKKYRRFVVFPGHQA
ncbi:MAG: tRNA (adenosine(37)-N6)-threonylcarbamoyltransferase complex ATPase subunit type 1 TsaE [Candidatus Omnitrophica bacterium]|nr:tRNA (adenosine(37)-N6)-threonylcarbamoyltransferase complex ATPase subunit type 1 TsaE [Candidatus Omnitrophota bacterium]